MYVQESVEIYIYRPFVSNYSDVFFKMSWYTMYVQESVEIYHASSSRIKLI